MSLEQFSDIWAHSPQTGEKLLILLALADCADFNGYQKAHPEYVAKSARISLERLHVLLRELEMSGDIRILYHDTFLGVQLSSPAQQLPTPRQSPIQSYLYRITGYVYLVQCGEYFKIGQTKNISRRIGDFSVQFPHKPELLHVIATEDHGALERDIHRTFSASRLNGEWFALTDKDIDAIRHYGCQHGGVIDNRRRGHVYLDRQGFHVPQSFIPE